MATGVARGLSRARQREAKVAAGLADLDRWLSDLVRSGLASLAARPESIWADQARRLVDAQCPGVARRVGALSGIARADPGWQVALLDRLGQLHLIAEGFRRRDHLPEAVLADLRAAIGYPNDHAALRAGTIGTRIRDDWHVLGQVFGVVDRIPMRRTSLQGATTGRWAQLIDFAGPGQRFEVGSQPGTTIAATLGFFPSAAPLRALVVEQHAPPTPLRAITATQTIAQAQANLGTLVARCPWVEWVPFALGAIALQRTEGGWRAVDPSGAFVPLSPRFDQGWHVLARSGGAPITLTGELGGPIFHPAGALVGESFMALADSNEATHVPPWTGAPGRWPTPATARLADLAGVAVLGTDRRSLPQPEPGDPLADLTEALSDQDPPSQLLALAAAAGLHARSGRRASNGPVPVPDLDPEVDIRPPCSPGAAACLVRLLIGEFAGSNAQRDLSQEWFTACDRAGQRVPDALLVPLLTAYQSMPLVAELPPILGARGRWLAGRNPHWQRYAGLPSSEAVATLWATGTKAERLNLLAELRRTDPAAARALLLTTFSRDPAAFRAEVLQALGRGLTLADEPMLEAALDDRSRDVRAAAAALLANIPGSRLVERMTARARAILGWAGGRLVVDLPAEADPDLMRDDITGVKGPVGSDGQPVGNVGKQGWLLIEILARTPPSRISEHLNQTPEAILAAAQRVNCADALVLGWKQAAVRFRDTAWSGPLIAHQLADWRQQRYAHIPGLLDALGPAARDALILSHLQTNPDLANPQSPVFTLLESIRGEVGPELGRELARRLGDTIGSILADLRAALPDESFQLRNRPPGWDRSQMTRWGQALPRLPVDLAEDVATRLAAEMALPTVHPSAPTLIAHLNQALDRWLFRRAIVQEFAPR